MKQIVTITTVIILVLLSQGCRHRTKRLEPYGWPLVDARFDSLSRVAEQNMYTSVSLDSITRQMDSIAMASPDNKNELLARTHYWDACKLYMNFEHDKADRLLVSADSLSTDLYTKERIKSLKTTFTDFKSYDSFCDLLRQLEYYASIGDLPQQGNTASTICSSLMYTEAPDAALYYLNMADSLYKASRNKLRSDNLRINKVTLLCIANKKDEAEELFQQLFSDSTITCNDLAHELLLRNHYYFFEDSASLFKAYDIRKDVEKETLQSQTLTLLYEALIGEYYMNHGQLDAAARYIEKRKIDPDSIRDEDLQLAIYEVDANYYEAIGEKDKAYDAACKITYINKNIAENQQPDNKIYTDFLNAEQQTRAEKKSLRTRLYVIIAVSIILLLSIIIIGRKWYSRYQIRHRETLRRAEQRERELMSMALTRQQGDRIIDYVGNEISRLSNQEEITGKDISQLDKNLKLHMLERENMQNFEETFTKIHPDFYSNLRTITPDLSDNQIRLCSYIMLGLNNQEIASLMNIKQSSLRQARLRLRQKFGITKDDSIQEFLRQITPPRALTA
ncbi:MAG: hypothetical protein HDT01_01030 [Bacteroidales bacterium]|nr:hypothetical protein [Bacteroidales bacterium]